MSQGVGVRNDISLDTIIINIVIIDAICGVIKADIGIKVFENIFNKSIL